MVHLCAAGLTRWATKALLILFTLFLILKLMEMTTRSTTAQLTEKRSTEPPSIKCHLSKPCPKLHFAFMVTSGMANVVGPKICLEDNILMSGVKNNVEKGLNIAVVNGRTGALIETASFNTYDGTKKRLIPFLKSISEDSIVMMTNYDDFSTKLTPEARNLIVNLGSSNITKIGFRDNWVFVGRKGMRNSPFELTIKRKLDGSWPDTLEMGGCVPRRGRDIPAT